MKRQQAFVASMINKVVSADTLTRPSRVYDFLEAATGSIATDPDLSSLSKLVNLAYQFRKHRPRQHHVHHGAVRGVRSPTPTACSGRTRRRGLWKVLLKDEPLPKRYREGKISAEQTPGGGSGSASGSTSGSVSGSASGSPASPSTATTEGDDTGGEQEADANGLCA